VEQNIGHPGDKSSEKSGMDQAIEEIMEGMPLWAQDLARNYGKQLLIAFTVLLVFIFIVVGVRTYIEHKENIAATKLGFALMIKSPSRQITALKNIISQNSHTDAADHAQLLLGAAFRRAGMLKDSQSAYQKAISDFSSDSVLKDSARMGLGYVNEELKLYKSAASQFQSVSSQRHGYEAIAARDLARVEEIMGNYQQAQSALNTYISLYPQASDQGFIRYQLAKIADEMAAQKAGVPAKFKVPSGVKKHLKNIQ